MASARFCPWDRAALVVCMDWGAGGWRAAVGRELGSWLMVSWVGVSSGLAARRDQHVLGTRPSTASQAREGIVLLFSAL